jgi:hypothetical protein
MQIDLQRFLEKVIHPEIMITADIVDLDAMIPEFMQSEEHFIVGFGDDMLVFEPEIKEIPKDHQAVAILFDQVAELCDLGQLG